MIICTLRPTELIRRNYMRGEYDFSKGKRGGFYHPNAKVHLHEKDDLVYGDKNNPGAAMTDYSLTPEAEALICTELQKAFSNALGIYAFGSRVQGMANAQSDLDLAVLVEGYADPLQLFEMANQLADKLGYEVDLLDLRAASTVMQHQVITTGRRLWAKDMQADLFDIFVTKEKWDLDALRAKQIDEIHATGSIYGK